MSFKKAKLIIGPSGSGKTQLANRIAEDYKGVVKLDLFKKCLHHFFFSDCERDTQLIIIDEIPSADAVCDLMHLVTEGVRVEKQMKEAFTIYPELVFICNESVKLESFSPFIISFNRRFDAIDLSNRGKRLAKVALDLFIKDTTFYGPLTDTYPVNANPNLNPVKS